MVMEAAEPPRATKPTRQSCRHCDLPLGRAWREEFGEFCCAGCRTVYDLIHREGLEQYYTLRPGGETPQPQLRPDSLAWLDALLNQQVTEEGRLARLQLDVQGVHCAACIWLLEQLWRRCDGAVELRINPALGRAEFAWDASRLDLRDYLRSAEGFGYRFGPCRKGELRSSRDIVVRLGICVAAALNVMIFSLCFYAGLGPEDGRLYDLFGWLNLGLATVAVGVGGWVFFRSAWLGLRRRVAHLDLPIALGIALGYGGSVATWIQQGYEAAYFDTITAFVALMVLGRWLQERVLERNRRMLLAADGVDNLYARRREGGVLTSISAAEIAEGDELWVVPGDLAPVEGVLLRDSARLSLDWITGESENRRFSPGERIPAGAFNAGDSTLRYAAIEGFEASRLHSLLTTTPTESTGGKGERWWNRVATIYVAAVLSLAVTGMLLWLPAGHARAIEVSVAILVLTCPCALGLATPLAHEMIHVAARRRGIFLRSGSFLHRALSVRKILFDKTGTLTDGQLCLSEPSRRALAGLPSDQRTVLQNLCAHSLHPVSRAIRRELGGQQIPLLEEFLVRERAGYGLEARDRGRIWRLGRPGFSGPNEVGEATAVLSVDDQPLLSLLLEERLKADAVAEVRALQDEGFDIHLLSGDREERVQRAARRLGIAPDHAQAELDPEAKAKKVRSLDLEDTLMIGDGINDGPSFDAAACAATPAIDRPQLPGRADFYFLGEGVSAVRTALGLARHLHRVVRGNLAFAVAYNLVAVGLCFAGLVSPLVAAVLMPASSITLLTITSVRLSGRRLAWTS